ncbi:MAG TPA: DUF6798 domain-containing protein [Blastocatellia bacterium]|nr:DUF6798 domain-containing protein [Blastocatellia bacterium]
MAVGYSPSETISDRADSSSRPLFISLLTIICIIGVTALIIGFNGGISVGASNHVGLLPVVRRILDPNYLPGDFNISLRLYHHRVFAYLIAGLSKLMGEEHGIVFLHLTGATLLSASLWSLCRALRLPLIAFVAAGLFLATGFLWTGLGLEENTFVGNQEVQPPLFAHAFVLLSAACLLRERWRLAAFFAGMAVLFHLQIGVIATLMIAPFYAVRLKSFGIKETARLAISWLIPASAASLHLLEMMQRGLLKPSSAVYSLAYYIDFRHPHHFAVMSAAHAFWTGGHILVQAGVWYWLSRMKREQSRLAGRLFALSAMLAVLALIHFTDYYLIRNDRLANLQMIRLSPLVTVFGALCLLLMVNVLIERGNRAWLVGAVNAGLMLLALGWGIHSTATDPEREFYLGVRRYSEKGNSWVRMCNWIRDHGPRDSVYLTPPANEGFTALTNRSNVVEFKINPDGALHLAEWFERLKDLTGGHLPGERGLKNRGPLNNAYAALSAQQLIALGAKYHAGYAVLPKSSAVGFETLSENEGYRLVKLPEKTA